LSGTIVLDNEAVQALSSPTHPKHRRALSHVQVTTIRKRKAVRAPRLLVPTAVRVEAGWDREDPGAAFVNRLGFRDAVLDAKTADLAARIRAERGVSVADAHVGAVVRLLPGEAQPVTIISSDRADMAAVCGAVPVIVVTL
jgi:hypothetical protein